ncbi:dihydrolipoamide acetyltransferase family protein [Enteractinococcus helveticum]|uniref:Dihydrolipoamide acetyltransferase component of pyruvate dehydrogenase complex n=1 Tax=Enteractinococcus helveticum TaxID=1837282 RepID=A0A1B7M0H1_9MICC|nr:dihydrolipoamide acetyltransferase family protein [Enteractinococcus helveticum]OAV61540.1 branched-chain alpha-keto acid dehydrogenase subunit E2 [Enteractinococcus helveticum]
MTTQVFQLPDLGEGLTEAELVKWLVAVGDTITVDQPIAEVETAKALVEVPSPYAGTVETLHGTPGDTLHVGNPLITIALTTDDGAPRPGALDYREEERAGITVSEDSDDEASGNELIGYGTSGGATTRRTRRSKRATKVSGNGTADPSRTSAAVSAPRVISPLVRLLAKRHGVDISRLTGSGPDGVILRADVMAAIDQPVQQFEAATPQSTQPVTKSAAEHVDAPAGLAVSERVPVTGVRKMIADQMVRSRSIIPDATSWIDVDVTELLELQARLKADNPETAPSLLGLIARFVTAALRRYPVLNTRFVESDDGAELVYFDGINLGIATDSERGLVVPAVEHAERYSARELTGQIKELVDKARRGQCTVAELTRGTFTLNNYGVLGVDGAAAIINAPEVAIMGVGRIIDRPWVVEGELAVRKVTELTLSFDHRVTDGATGSAFLTAVADAMQHPTSVLADL